MSEKIELRVNGEIVSFDVEEDETLLDTLRGKSGDTSARYACGIGVCGACTVLIEGDVVSSCLQLTSMTTGRNVETPEHVLTRHGGLGREVTQAFIESGAFQCSYCIPAMALTVTYLLERDDDVTAEDIREGLAGNLCRCGSYPQILDAAATLVDRRCATTDTVEG